MIPHILSIVGQTKGAVLQLNADESVGRAYPSESQAPDVRARLTAIFAAKCSAPKHCRA